MKTNLLTLLIFAIASVLYSCSKESDDNSSAVPQEDNSTALTAGQRRIIISNCSGHAGCHAGARLADAGTIQEANYLLKSNFDSNHNLSDCKRNELKLWFNSEASK